MKRLIFILAIFISLYPSFTSCNKMDVFPRAAISDAVFWSTESDVTMALGGVYTFMRDGYLTEIAYLLDGATDDGWISNTGTIIAEMQRGGAYSQYAGPSLDAGNIILGLFPACYKGIAASNNFLKNLELNAVKIGLSPEKRAAFEAEAKFLRAYFYFQLVIKYKDVPLYTSALETIDDSKVKQSPAADVYAFIHQDLDFAIGNLPDKTYSDGHVVKGSAQALKAKVALTQEDWNTVETLTKAVITDNKFSLSPDYPSIFIKREGQKDNPELMFTVTYLKGVVQNQMERRFYGYNHFQPLDNLGAIYEDNDLRRKEWLYKMSSIPSQEWTNPFGDKITNFPPSQTGWLMTKLIDKYNRDFYSLGAENYNTDNDIVLLRYADVLLMYVEAMVEKGGGSTTDALALECINQIRSRAEISTLESISRDELRLERRREFLNENNRYFDITRWKIAEQVLNGLVLPNGVGKFLPHFYTWPFPQSEIDINPELDQKPGY